MTDDGVLRSSIFRVLRIFFGGLSSETIKNNPMNSSILTHQQNHFLFVFQAQRKAVPNQNHWSLLLMVHD